MSWYDPNYNSAVATSVASGSAVSKLFITLGIIYLIVMMYGVFNIRVPAADWKPAGFDPATLKAKPLVTTSSVSAANAIKTPQFYFLWIVLFCNVAAGIGILEQASPMIQDFFRENGTTSVTVAAAGGFVGILSLANMAGRFVWSSTSDVIGRKPIYMLYLGVGIICYLLLATAGHTSTALFVILAMLILSFYGGGFATVPAYLRDLFGTFQVGAIHGRLLTAWSAAGVVGPLIVNGFLDSKGTPGKLTVDAYRPALYTMMGLLAIGFIANLLIKPVASRFYEPSDEQEPIGPAPTEREKV
jgi:MFS family permease